MEKEIISNNKKYFVTTAFDKEKKRVVIKAYGPKPSQYEDSPVIHRSFVKNNFFLNMIGLNSEKRIIFKIRRAIRIIEKHSYKREKLLQALKEAESIFSLDEKMNL
ncbi:gp288 [Bacillus phage G]|uniref:Gp288 n=1 Tax=Bacillus phage G TaxID=2884420 RepID=G3MA29_9CAUD|nr:gp288 [Bacillus phage G]AEO93547.1 gp288 [Bacillus phage G]